MGLRIGAAGFGLALVVLLWAAIRWLHSTQYPPDFWDQMTTPVLAVAGICIGWAANATKLHGISRFALTAVMALLAYLILLVGLYMAL